MSWNYYGFRPYVSVAERRRKAAKAMAKLAKNGQSIRPVQIEGRASLHLRVILFGHQSFRAECFAGK